ncbi:recombinase family protein [Chloroflexales bacterium ZM16-3]|nr:recombinase family protein [Chloroflexales bacterium ZM16-3]
MARTPKANAQTIAVYLRISTEEQRKGNGIDSQLAACEAYAEKRGYTIVAICKDEALSGALCVDKRPELKRAIELCEAGKAAGILAYAQDRFARSSGLFDELRTRAQKGKYRLETADGRILTDEDDELSGDAMSFVASIERKLIAKRLRGGRKERAKVDGRGSGPLPYGYTYDSDGNIAVSIADSVAINRLFELRKEFSIRKTVEILNAECLYKYGVTHWSVTLLQRVEANKELYTTGIKTWGGITANELWPIVVED